jgi:hypothetical protein
MEWAACLDSHAVTELWREAIRWMRSGGMTTEPWPKGRDRARVRMLLWELYLLGERPTPEEIRIAGGRDGKATTWSRAVADLWRDRTSSPLQIPFGDQSFRHPFIIPALEIEKNGLDSIESRLAAQVVSATERYEEALATGASEDDVLELEAILSLQVHALRVWGETQLLLRRHPEEDVFGGGLRGWRRDRFIWRHPRYVMEERLASTD